MMRLIRDAGESNGMDVPRREFLDGERPDDVVIYVTDDALANPERLATRGERLDDGVVLVLPGERGRAVFESAVGMDPMNFAGTAMNTEGDVDADLAGATCPSKRDDEPEDDHGLRFVFAFAEAQNEDVGGLYAEGAVVHAYALCSCGTAYSDRWVVGDRPVPEE